MLDRFCFGWVHYRMELINARCYVPWKFTERNPLFTLRTVKISTQRNPKSNTKLNPTLKTVKLMLMLKLTLILIYRRLSKKTLKSKKIIARTGTGFEPGTRDSISTTPTPYPLCHGAGTWCGRNLRSFNKHQKGKKCSKNKTNTVRNPTTNPNPNPTIDEAGKRKGTE